MTSLVPPASAGLARAAPMAEPSARRLVTVTISGEASPALLEVLRERIGGSADETTFASVPTLDRETIITRGPPRDNQLARIWIDLRDPRAPITLYVVDGPWERVLERAIARQPNPEVSWEEIGHIVELALAALRAGEAIGVVVQEPPAPPPTAPAPTVPAPKEAVARTAPRAPPKLRAGAFYSGVAYGSDLEVATGPGGVVELHAPGDQAFASGLTVTGEYRLPSTVHREDAAVRFEGGAAFALLDVTYTVAPRHQTMLGIGAGVELVHARGTGPARVRFVDGTVEAIPAPRVLARYGWTTSAVRLFGGLGVDVPLRNPRYFLSRDGSPVVLFEPWPVRPFALVGIETN